ncbi:MAG: tryptophan synthase subunit alpha [Spartobacteria bacterium]|nr:tryptophan synthase subunit alpha [Spartobacteria bacterium]
MILDTRISRTFKHLKASGKKGFIAYITAGDPTLQATIEVVHRLEEVGVDIIELGIPFSDPLADGRVNQEAAERALQAGATFSGVLDAIATIRKTSEIPILFFSYLNPLFARDFRKSVRQSATAGVDGCLLLDLPIEESAPYVQELQQANLDNVTLVTPTTPDKRIGEIVRTASGFVYCVSRTGVTGMQDKTEKGAEELLRHTRKLTDLPVALGFGISTPGQAAAAAGYADAVVVGSAIVQKFHTMPQTSKGRREAAAWVGNMVKAVKEV